MDRTWTVNYTSADAIQAGYNDDLEFVFKELGKTYLAIWQAWNLGKHVTRHYLDIFTDSCRTCHGAGTIICPHCGGYKNKRMRPDGFHLSALGAGTSIEAVQDSYECHHCGTYTTWDQQKKWGMLTAVKEVVSEIESGCFTEGGKKFTDDEPDEDNSKEFEPEQYLSADGDTDYAGYYTGDENGEVHPKRLHFSEWVYNHPEYYDHLSEEVESDAINNNIAAAVADRPKPYMFEPTAGTVICPDCHGDRWFWGLAPNLHKLGGYRLPFWATTLRRMGTYYKATEAPARSRPYLEYPLRPTAPPPLYRSPMPEPLTNGTPAGINGSALVNVLGPKHAQRSDQLQYALQNFEKLSEKMSPDEKEEFRVQLLNETQPGQGESSASDAFSDPLSDNPEKIVSEETLANWKYNEHPITGDSPGLMSWLFGPYNRRQEAARIRDLRRLQACATPEQREAQKDYMVSRLRWQGRVPGAPVLEEVIPPEEIAGSRR